jgi:hypothetical protein
MFVLEASVTANQTMSFTGFWFHMLPSQQVLGNQEILSFLAIISLRSSFLGGLAGLHDLLGMTFNPLAVCQCGHD